MRTASSYGTGFGTEVFRDPYRMTVQPRSTTFGLGTLPDGSSPGSEAPGELTTLTWVLAGAAIGWSATAYSTAKLGTTPLVGAWGGASAGVFFAGIRRLVNGDGQGVGPAVLGLAMGAAGFFFARGQRGVI